MLARPRVLKRAPHVIAVGALVASAVVWSSSAATAATSAPADQWTSTGAGGGQARVNAGEHVLISGHLHGLHEAWSEIVQASTYAPPTIVAGVAYTAVDAVGTNGSDDYSAVIARNAVTGAVKWQSFLPVADQANIGFGVADSGGVLVEPVDSTDLNPGLIGLDPKTGRILWEQHFPSYGTVNGFAANDGIVFAQNGNTLQARNSTTGALLWSLNTLTVTKYWEQYGVIWNGIAAGDHAVFLDTSYGLYSLNEATGHLMWSADIQASSNSDRSGSVAAGGGHVYVAGTQIEAFTENGCGKSTCTPVWINRVGNPPTVGGGLMVVGAVTSTTLAVYAALYTTPASFVLASLSATTGATRWTAKANSSPVAFPIQGGNVIWQQIGEKIEAFPINCAKVCLPAATIADPNATDIVGLSVSDGSLFIQSWSQELDVYRT